jgi:hypothetical protein
MSPRRLGATAWAPEYTFLATRLAALRLPGQSDTGFHIHARLRIFVDGRRVPVPSQIGIDPQGRFTDMRIGGYADAGDRRLRVYVDGRPVADPVDHVLRGPRPHRAGLRPAGLLPDRRPRRVPRRTVTP